MPEVCVNLSEKEYELLTRLDNVEGKDGGKLRSLFRYYLFSMPALKSSYYALKRFENKEEIEDILKYVSTAYKNAEHPIESWEIDKMNKLIGELTEINVLLKVDGQQTEMNQMQAIPSRKFRGLYKKLLHDIATERKDMDEYIAGYVAIIQLLMEFGVGTLDKEKTKDATIFINDVWLSPYPKAMKEAREFQRTKKLRLKLKTPKTPAKKQLADIKL